MSSVDGLARQSAIGFERDRGNDLPVLHELHHALAALLLHGTESVVDLKSLPFGEADEQRLEQVLGIGEVEVMLHTLGESRIFETAFPGIWWVEHRNEQGEVTARSVEVTFIPEILKSQEEDVAAARRRLDSLLQIVDPGADSGDGSSPT